MQSGGWISGGSSLGVKVRGAQWHQPGTTRLKRGRGGCSWGAAPAGFVLAMVVQPVPLSGHLRCIRSVCNFFVGLTQVSVSFSPTGTRLLPSFQDHALRCVHLCEGCPHHPPSLLSSLLMSMPMSTCYCSSSCSQVKPVWVAVFSSWPPASSLLLVVPALA